MNQNSLFFARVSNMNQFANDLDSGFLNPKQTYLSEKIYKKHVGEKIIDDINKKVFPEFKAGVHKSDIFKNTIPCTRFVSKDEVRLRCIVKLVGINDVIKRVEWNDHINQVRDKLQEEIDANEVKIEADHEEIEANKANIEVNKEEIKANDNDIVTINSEIDANDQDIEKAEKEADDNFYMNISQYVVIVVGYVLTGIGFNKVRPNIPKPVQGGAKFIASAVGQAVTGGVVNDGANMQLQDTELGKLRSQIANVETVMKHVQEELSGMKRRVR